MTTRYVGDGLIGVQPRIWQPSVIYAQGETVRSPLDFELYTRIAAMGADTVDPANDITNYVACSFERIGSLGDIGLVPDAIGANRFATNITKTLLTAWAANQRKLLFSASGRGALLVMGLSYAPSSTATVRVVLIVDGRSVYDRNLSWPAGSSMRLLLRGIPSSGAATSGESPNAYYVLGPDRLVFRRSIGLYITSSLALSGATAGDATWVRVQPEA